MYRIVVKSFKFTYYWMGNSAWSTLAKDAKLYCTKKMAQSSIGRMSPDNKRDAYVEKVKSV